MRIARPPEDSVDHVREALDDFPELVPFFNQGRMLPFNIVSAKPLAPYPKSDRGFGVWRLGPNESDPFGTILSVAPVNVAITKTEPARPKGPGVADGVYSDEFATSDTLEPDQESDPHSS